MHLSLLLGANRLLATGCGQVKAFVRKPQTPPLAVEAEVVCLQE